MSDEYQFEDIDSTSDISPVAKSSSGNGNGNSNGKFADELYSKQIKAKFRTFYIDLKQSHNGKFIKISEKSHGRKSTIMMDAEDIPVFIDALKEVQGQI
jgi:hypothetical protein